MFHGRKTISGQPIGRFAGEITDDAIAALRDLIVKTYGFDPRRSMSSLRPMHSASKMPLIQCARN